MIACKLAASQGRSVSSRPAQWSELKIMRRSLQTCIKTSFHVFREQNILQDLYLTFSRAHCGNFQSGKVRKFPRHWKLNLCGCIWVLQSILSHFFPFFESNTQSYPLNQSFSWSLPYKGECKSLFLGPHLWYIWLAQSGWDETKWWKYKQVKYVTWCALFMINVQADILPLLNNLKDLG